MRRILNCTCSKWKRRKQNWGEKLSNTNLVNVAKNDVFHDVVLEHLPDDTTIAATNDEHLLGIRVARER